MIENKSIGSKVFDVVNVVILILITLVCILPVWYVLCVSLSSREAVSAGKVALWPVGFNLLSYMYRFTMHIMVRQKPWRPNGQT